MVDGDWRQGEIERRFSQRLKAIRKALDWSAQALANRLTEQGHTGLSRVAISKIECQNRRVSLDDAVALCAAFDVPLADMVAEGPFRFTVRAEVEID